ncbi:MAG: chitosanase [Planctomycetota bacterium]
MMTNPRSPGRFPAYAVLTAGTLLTLGCATPGGGGGGGGTPAPEPCDATAAEAAGLMPEQKLRADRLISVFENDTIEIQYAYVEALDDGRGYTAGRAGFTTATGDVLDVVERYAAEVPEAELAAYLPRLRELADQQSSAIDGLEGFPEDWAQAAEDERFRGVQDDVVDETYYHPAIARACGLGLSTPLARAELYDAIIQHGEGDDPDGLPALIQRTVDRAGGSPATGVDETEWFYAFLEVRRATLENAFDPETRAAWAESVYRVEIVETIADGGNFDFNGPIVIDTPDHQATIP